MAQAGQSDSYEEELARIDASIAELKIRDMAAAKERTNIAAKIQAAQFQRDILAHANQQKKRAAKPARKVRRRPPGDRRPELPGPGPVGRRRVDLSRDGSPARVTRSAAFRARFHRSPPA